jgi:hypothetical protein
MKSLKTLPHTTHWGNLLTPTVTSDAQLSW